MSKLAEDTQINKTAESIPDKEMHGLWLAASNMIKAIQDIKEAKIPIEAAYLGVDALSQVVGLMKPPHVLKQKLRRYYANINLHLFEIAKLTDQKKEDIIFWIDQKDQPNPADKLGKFDIDKEKVDKWMDLAKEVLFPPWLQAHPNSYLEKMLNKSREQIRLLKQGGKLDSFRKQQEPLDEEIDSKAAKVNHINCYEGYYLILSFKENPYDSSLLQTIVDNNKHQGSAKCMKIMGLVTYAAHT